MSEPTGKLARWRSMLSAFEFDIVHGTGVKQEAADALSRGKTRSAEKTSQRNEVAVLIILQELFASAPKTDVTDFELIEDPKGQFIPSIPEI